jgi:hypothetical protein
VDGKSFEHTIPMIGFFTPTMLLEEAEDTSLEATLAPTAVDNNPTDDRK